MEHLSSRGSQYNKYSKKGLGSGVDVIQLLMARFLFQFNFNLVHRRIKLLSKLVNRFFHNLNSPLRVL